MLSWDALLQSSALVNCQSGRVPRVQDALPDFPYEFRADELSAQ
jgi:hypothetical protein